METLSSWSRALRDPSLRDLPYKIETNEHGPVGMSPQTPGDGLLQGRGRFFDLSGELSASAFGPSSRHGSSKRE